MEIGHTDRGWSYIERSKRIHAGHTRKASRISKADVDNFSKGANDSCKICVSLYHFQCFKNLILH